jgi:hypothetical protein
MLLASGLRVIDAATVDGACAVRKLDGALLFNSYN